MATWEFEFPVPGSLVSTKFEFAYLSLNSVFQVGLYPVRQGRCAIAAAKMIESVSAVLRPDGKVLSIQHTSYNLLLTLYTLHPRSNTVHNTPCTINPTAYTLRPTPYTLNPTSYTLHV